MFDSRQRRSAITFGQLGAEEASMRTAQNDKTQLHLHAARNPVMTCPAQSIQGRAADWRPFARVQPVRNGMSNQGSAASAD